MKVEQFNQLAKEGYNRIPIVKEILADLDTPLSAYVKLAQQPYSYLFESVHNGVSLSRYSFIGLPCRTVIKVHGYDITVQTDNEITEKLTVDDPLEWIKQYQSRFKVASHPTLPSRFNGGLVGYFSYDSVRYMEPRLGPCPNKDITDTPDIVLMLSDELLVFDNLSGKMYCIVHVDPAKENALQYANARLAELDYGLRHCAWPENTHEKRKVQESDFTTNFSYEEYAKNIDKIKQYIYDGDVMQVVLSRRLDIEYTAPPLDLYRALRFLNPSPYMYFLNLADHYVAGSSPETLTHIEDNTVIVRPLAGTRKRGATPAEDLALEKELLADEKELAEHLMLIDLARNDIGRVAEIGSVKVTEKMVIERYSHVMHISSNVIGKLKPGLTAIDALRTTFPAGTLSGAPKIRAMEILDELETTKRGVYGGAVGYLAWNGNMDVAIAIRTAVLKDGVVTTQVGGGIVADSTPQGEWDETIKKGSAVFKAVALAENNLDE